MKVGDLVKVRTKHYGVKHGMIIKHGLDGWFVRPTDHPCLIIARTEDLEVISEAG